MEVWMAILESYSTQNRLILSYLGLCPETVGACCSIDPNPSL